MNLTVEFDKRAFSLTLSIDIFTTSCIRGKALGGICYEGTRILRCKGQDQVQDGDVRYQGEEGQALRSCKVPVRTPRVLENSLREAGQRTQGLIFEGKTDV